MSDLSIIDHCQLTIDECFFPRMLRELAHEDVRAPTEELERFIRFQLLKGNTVISTLHLGPLG